jgi:arginine decarboxylase
MDPHTGQRYAFEDAPLELLANEPQCWFLRDGDEWHGFKVLNDWPMSLLDCFRVQSAAGIPQPPLFFIGVVQF